MSGQKPQQGQVCTKPVLLGGLAAAAVVFKELLPTERDNAWPLQTLCFLSQIWRTREIHSSLSLLSFYVSSVTTSPYPILFQSAISGLSQAPVCDDCCSLTNGRGRSLCFQGCCFSAFFLHLSQVTLQWLKSCWTSVMCDSSSSQKCTLESSMKMKIRGLMLNEVTWDSV